MFGFFTGLFGHIFKNIQLYLMLAVVAAVIGAGFFIYNTGAKVEAQRGEIKELTTQLDKLNTTFEDYKKNAVTVENINELKRQTTNTQYVVKDRIRDVPVKAEDRPFVADPGLLDRVDIMREHQAQYTTPR